MKLNRVGIRRLIASGQWSGVTLSKRLQVSRTWFIELMKGREMRHPGVTAYMNHVITTLLSALKKKA